MSALTEVTLTLRPANPLPAHAAQPGGKHLSHAEIAEGHGAHPSARKCLEDFARRHHLEVAELNLPHRIARLRGSAAAIEHAFPPGNTSPNHVPPTLGEDVEAVTGLHPEPRIRRPSVARPPHDGRARTLTQLADAYAFPPCPDLRDQTIGILEFGGGFHPADIAHFCQTNGVPTPAIETIDIGAANHPAPPNAVRHLLDCMDGRTHASPRDLATDPMQHALFTLEVTMDLEIIAALAPGARIAVYFAPPEAQLHALHRAVYDHQHRPSVLSISWGQPETELSAASIHATSRILETAAHLGITVCASSGDSGALNGSSDGTPTVNFPASSPFCLACGGTTTYFAAARDQLRVRREIVWNTTHHSVHGASGGGVSRIFAPPQWQQHSRVPLSPAGHHGRGVPDVAGAADPRFGCDLLIAGRTFRSAGTSAVAPVWAALIARCNAALGARCGHINPHLYRLAEERQPGLRPVLKGSNGAYHAGPGWNPCTGHGTPIGVDLLRSIQQTLHT